MRRAIATLFVLLVLAAAPLPAQKKAVPLEIVGETYLVVKAVPFKVVAPPGAADYTWTLPAGVEATEEDNVLTVTKAPQGQFVIKVKTTTIDFDAKKFKKDVGAVTVTMGGVDPKPPTPTPTPTPDAGLARSMADALAKDADADKLTLARKLGSIYRTAANSIVGDSSVTTAGQIDDAVRKTAQQTIGNLTIPGVRDAAGTYLKGQLPADPKAALDDAARQKYRAAFLSLADALEGLK